MTKTRVSHIIMIQIRTLLFGVVLFSIQTLAETPGEVLDEFHEAAARADLEGYFGLMTDNVVFLGTDGTERWQGQEFRNFVTPHFESGRGWEYLPTERYIIYSDDNKAAWFDETLKHAALGRCRGTGVLVQRDGAWKIAQYNLSVPIPNDLVLTVVDQIQSQSEPVPVEASQAGELQAEEPQDNPVRCRKKRHKTNSPAGC